jgi:hypothetical protein
MSKTATSSPKKPQLRRYGGDWQPQLETFEDAVAALLLPDTAWAVLSCPVDGMDLDADFLGLIDRDGDGRVRADDVRLAVQWTADRFSDWSDVTAGAKRLRLDALSPFATAQAATGAALAQRLELAPNAGLSLADLHNTEALCQCGDRDGDGVVPLDCIGTDFQGRAAAILMVCDAELDRHGKPGISCAVLDQFTNARDEWLAWRNVPGPHRPWGDLSERAGELFEQCDPAVSAWFSLRALYQREPDVAAALLPAVVTIANSRDPVEVASAMDHLPLAALDCSDDGQLVFDALRPGTLTPALRELIAIAFPEVRGIDEATWSEQVVLARRVGGWHREGRALIAGSLEPAELERLDDACLEELRALCVLDQQNQETLRHLLELEQLLVYQQYLFNFCRNFMALTNLIEPRSRALFERGTLVLGGREFSFAMRVRDPEAHKLLAAESGIFVLYVDVVMRPLLGESEPILSGLGLSSPGHPSPTGEPITEQVAVPVTRGTSAGLYKGRRGIFIDRQGRNHEAQVIDLVKNPVSLQEALLAPFERIGNYISGKLEKWTAKLETNLDKQVAEVSKATPPPPAAGMNPILGGTVAFAAASSAFAFVTSQLSELGGPKILIALVVVAMLVAIPTIALAAVRLYRRNLAGLIAASGWALNDRMRLTVGLGRLFTRRPPLPDGVSIFSRDLVTQELQALDPGAIWRARTAAFIRVVTLLAVLLMLFATVMPRSLWPWLDYLVWASAGGLTFLLAMVCAGFVSLRRFRAVYWWPVAALPVVGLLSAAYLAGG